MRLAAWVSLALISGISAYYLYQHPIQIRSDTVAAADPMKQVQQLAQQQVQAATRDILIETRRLSAAVGTLNTDRDRLYSRLSTIEQNIDSVTGSLARQTQAVPPASTSSSMVAASPPPVPAGSPLATSSNTLTSNSAADATLTRASFGVDLGSAPTVDGLRTLWRKDSATFAALASLQPVVAVRERPGTGGVNLRLIVGPLSDAAAAAKLCASLTAGAPRPCEPAVYDGQRLAMDAAPVAPPKKPVPLRLPSAPKQPVVAPQILPR